MVTGGNNMKLQTPDHQRVLNLRLTLSPPPQRPYSLYSDAAFKHLLLLSHALLAIISQMTTTTTDIRHGATTD